MKGEKRSIHRGTSVEFADYREYNPGDDLRYVDWNLAARLEKLFVKLFVEEEDLYVAILLDASASMGFGTPSKLYFAARVAAAIGYIGMTSYNRVSLTVLPADPAFSARQLRTMPPRRGRAAVIPFFRMLNGVSPAGEAALAQSLRAFAIQTRYRGLAVLISDFMDAGWKDGVQALVSRGYEVVAVHVLSEEELHPDLAGDIRILDSETGDTKEMSVTPALLKRYQQALEDFCSGIRNYASRTGATYIQASSREDLEAVVLRRLHRAGIIS